MSLDPILYSDLNKVQSYGGFQEWIDEAEIVAGDTIEILPGAFPTSDLSQDFLTLETSAYPTEFLDAQDPEVIYIRDHPNAEISSMYDAASEITYGNQMINTTHARLTGLTAVAKASYPAALTNAVLYNNQVIGVHAAAVDVREVDTSVGPYVPNHQEPKVYTPAPSSIVNNWGWGVAWNSEKNRLMVSQLDTDATQSLYQYEITDWASSEAWAEIQCDAANPDIVTADDLGESICSIGRWTALACPKHDIAGGDDGSIQLWEWDGVDRFAYSQQITPNNVTSNALFGRFMAMRKDSSGDYWIFASNNRQRGVEVWKDINGTWTFQQEMANVSGADGGIIGIQVDGNGYLIIADGNANAFKVYYETGGVWTAHATQPAIASPIALPTKAYTAQHSAPYLSASNNYFCFLRWSTGTVYVYEDANSDGNYALFATVSYSDTDPLGDSTYDMQGGTHYAAYYGGTAPAAWNSGVYCDGKRFVVWGNVVDNVWVSPEFSIWDQAPQDGNGGSPSVVKLKAPTMGAADYTAIRIR